MKNKVTVGVVVILLLMVSFLLGIFVDDFTKPSKTETLAMLFSYPGGSVCENPCLLGIQPGITTIDQAKEILTLHNLSKGGEVFPDRNGDRNYLTVALQNNGLRIEVDDDKNVVLDVTLYGSFIRGLGGHGYSGVVINGYKFTFEDIQSYLGAFESIKAVSGDGGIISQVVALYEGNWCVYPSYFEESATEFTVAPDAYVEDIAVNCYWTRPGE